MYKIDNIDAACRHVGYMVPLWLTDLMDSAFATASAQGQLKGVRPCQSIQECWQTVQTCVCVFVRGLGSTRWAVSWPKPQPDFINHGRKRAQPLTLGLKTWLSTFLPCLLLRLGACSASFSSHLALPFTISHCLLADNSGRVYSTEDFKGGNDWTQECHVVRKASFFFFFLNTGWALLRLIYCLLLVWLLLFSVFIGILNSTDNLWSCVCLIGSRKCSFFLVLFFYLLNCYRYHGARC